MSNETISFFHTVYFFPYEENKLLFIQVYYILSQNFYALWSTIFGSWITLSNLLFFADKCVKPGDEYNFIFTFE